MKITKQDLIGMGCDPDHVEDWFEIRKAKKKPFTGTALKRMMTESTKAGLTLPAAVQRCAEEGWIGFKADYVKVVTGSNGILIREKLNQFAVDVIVNNDYRSGMLSSVQEGLRLIPEDAKAIMILLGDQPMIKTEVIDMLIEAYNNNAERIVVPTYKGKKGHPLLIDISFSTEIEKLDPEQGLRQLLIQNPEEILEVEVDTSSILKDIDTKEDYKLAIK